MFRGIVPERANQLKRPQKQKGQKAGLWIGIACAVAVCFSVTYILVSRGAELSVSIETENLLLERTDIQSLKVCYITVEPHTIQVEDERFSEEAETVLISDCEMEELRPLLEMKNLREIVFSDALILDLSALGQIGTLERVTFQDCEMYDFTAIPLNVELCITRPVVREGTISYGEQRAPDEFLIPFRFGDRAISWDLMDSSTVRFDEASQTLVSGTVKRNIAAGYEKADLMGTAENTKMDLTPSLRVGDAIRYNTTSEEGSFLIAPFATIHRTNRIEPIVKNCYGVEVQFKYSVQKGSFG